MTAVAAKVALSILLCMVAAVAVAGNGDNPPWFPSLMASEHYDSGRTHLFDEANFNGSFTRANKVEVLQSPPPADPDQQYLTPYNVVYRSAGSMFLYGGGYGDKGANGHYVAKVDPKTLQPVWFDQLETIETSITRPQPGPKPAWDYPGVVGILKDGFLYVIYGTTLAKIDPKDGSAQTLPLPTPLFTPAGSDQQEPYPAVDTSYNGFDALPDGTIIAKTVYRDRACWKQGFDAFLDCPLAAEVPNSILVAIDPENFSIIGNYFETPEFIVGRVTTSHFNDKNYIYLSGSDKIYRFIYADGAFTPDDDWKDADQSFGVSYLPHPNNTGQNTASALIVMNDWVVFTTNGGPVDVGQHGIQCAHPGIDPECQSPWLTLYAINQADPTWIIQSQPFKAASPAQPREDKFGNKYPISFAPSSVTVDPLRNRIYAFDAGPGYIAAFDLLPEGKGKFEKKWMVEQTTTEFMALIGPPNRRVLVATNTDPTQSTPGKNANNTVVWRDAETGRVLATSPELISVNTGTMVEPGYGGDMYYMVQPNPNMNKAPFPDGSIIKLTIHPF